MNIIDQIEDARSKALAAFHAWKKEASPENFWRWREAQAVEQSLRALDSMPTFCTEYDYLKIEGEEKETPP